MEECENLSQEYRTNNCAHGNCCVAVLLSSVIVVVVYLFVCLFVCLFLLCNNSYFVCCCVCFFLSLCYQ